MGLGALAALVVSILSGAWVQTPPATAQAPAGSRPRIALVNLHEVLKDYQKLKLLQEQFKQKAQAYDDQLKKMKEQMDQLQEEYKKAATPQDKERLESAMSKLRFEAQDLNTKGQKDLMKFQEDQMALVYREVDQVVREYAAANGIDLVLRFREDWGADYHKPQHIVARLNSPFWPMYFDASVNITGQIRDLLFRRYANGQGTGAPGGG
jgi:Skp family chaperone for outer membrane proteins